MKEMVQVIALVITVFCAAVFVNGACAANEAAHVFWTYVESNDLQVRVAKVDGFKGPVNAIFSAGFDASTLEPPTKQQRYWGLVQDSLIDTTVDVGKEHSSDPSGILRGRDYLFITANAFFGHASHGDEHLVVNVGAARGGVVKHPAAVVLEDGGGRCHRH